MADVEPIHPTVSPAYNDVVVSFNVYVRFVPSGGGLDEAQLNLAGRRVKEHVIQCALATLVDEVKHPPTVLGFTAIATRHVKKPVLLLPLPDLRDQMKRNPVDVEPTSPATIDWHDFVEDG